MRLRILYVEETCDRVVIAGREVARMELLSMRTWEDQRRTQWPSPDQMLPFAARIAARDWNLEQWECVGMVPIGQVGPRTMAMLWSIAGDRLNEADVIFWLRRREPGTSREGQA
jgi:hypothetical protein